MYEKYEDLNIVVICAGSVKSNVIHPGACCCITACSEIWLLR